MLKGIGIFLLMISCLLLGNRFSGGLKENVRIMEQSGRLAESLGTAIRYTAQPLQSLLLQIQAESLFPSLPFLSDLLVCSPERLTAQWEQGVGALPEHLPLEDRELLLAFGRQLGRTDVAGQQEHCRLYAGRFEQRRAIDQQEFIEKGRLYQVLGVLAGLASALLLI